MREKRDGVEGTIDKKYCFFRFKLLYFVVGKIIQESKIPVP